MLVEFFEQPSCHRAVCLRMASALCTHGFQDHVQRGRRRVHRLRFKAQQKQPVPQGSTCEDVGVDEDAYRQDSTHALGLLEIVFECAQAIESGPLAGQSALCKVEHVDRPKSSMSANFASGNLPRGN